MEGQLDDVADGNQDWVECMDEVLRRRILRFCGWFFVFMLVFLTVASAVQGRLVINGEMYANITAGVGNQGGVLSVQSLDNFLVVQNGSLANFSLNLSSMNASFNETGLINAVNTSGNVKGLGFNTTVELSNIFLDEEVDPVFVANRSSIWSGINSKLDVVDQRYNDSVLVGARALPGSCPSGYVVMNTTTSGVQCVIS